MGCHQNMEVNGYAVSHQFNITHGTHRTWRGFKNMADDQTRQQNQGHNFDQTDLKMDSSAAAKRRRYSTGGTSEAVTRDGLPFSMLAAESEVCQMSDSEKFNFIIGKLQSIESLTLELQRTRVRLDETHDMIDQMSVAMTDYKDELTMAQHRINDLEARSRRQNLIFAGIPENENESDSDCKTTLLSFMRDTLQLDRDVLNGLVLQQVHRLGGKRVGMARNGQAWRPRPIIAAFRDYEARDAVFSNAKNLKWTHFVIHQEFPSEIRSARGELWKDFCRARAQKLKATIAYPAKLIVEGNVFRNLFPLWGQWSVRDESQNGPVRGAAQVFSSNNVTRNRPSTPQLADLSRPIPSSQPERVRHPLPNRPMMLGEAPVMVTQLVCNRNPVPAPLCRDHHSPTGSGHQLTFPPGTRGNTPSQSRPCPHFTNLYLKLCSPQLPPTRTSTGPFTSL